MQNNTIASPSLLCSKGNKPPQDTAPSNTHDTSLITVNPTYGEELPYERERVVHEAKFFMGKAAQTMLEAGKRLILLKEHERHGDFLEIIQKRLQLSPRTAQIMMKAAVKYSSQALAGRMHAFTQLGKAKLIELMIEDDKELVYLADGGTLAGLTLDDIDRMSVRDLRSVLRAERQLYPELKDNPSLHRQKKSHEVAPGENPPEAKIEFIPHQRTENLSEHQNSVITEQSNAYAQTRAQISQIALILENIYHTKNESEFSLACQTISTALKNLNSIIIDARNPCTLGHIQQP